MLLRGWKCTVTQKMYLNRGCWRAGQDLLMACRLFSFVFNFCLSLLQQGGEKNCRRSDCFLSAVTFSCCLPALLFTGSGLPVPLSLQFPFFFF